MTTPLNVLVEMTWFKTELIAFLGVILSNVGFMLMRSITKPGTKVDFQDKTKRLPDVDSVAALNVSKNEFTDFFVPCVVGYYCTTTFYIKYNVGHEFMRYITYSAFAQLMILTFLIFGKWKKGGEKWLKIAPKLFYCLTILLYVIMPIAYLAIFNFMFNIITSSLYGLTFVPLMGMALLRIPFYLLVIRRQIIKDSKAYLAKRKASLQLRQELSDQIDFSNSLEGSASFG